MTLQTSPSVRSANGDAPTQVLADAPSSGSESGRIQSVERAARILLAFGTAEQQLTVGDLARMLDVHKSTASRLVATLVAHGLLARGSGDDHLQLGPELARLGRLAADGPSLIELAAPALEALTAETGESTTLSIADEATTRTLVQHEGRFLIGMQDWTGRPAPLHATSDGKVLLAFGAAAVPAGELAALTPATITDRAALVAELDDVRACGWARSLGEFEPGLHGVAAPVLDAAGRCRAAVCLSGPAYRLAEAELPEFAAHCRVAADRVSAALALAGPTFGPVL